jgi:hypothetical protein
MRTLIISAVLAVTPACSLFVSTDRSQVSQPPDAGTDNDACHGGGGASDAGGCCGGTPDGGPEIWPDGGPQDGGGWLPDGGFDSPDGGVVQPDGGY